MKKSNTNDRLFAVSTIKNAERKVKAFDRKDGQFNDRIVAFDEKLRAIKTDTVLGRSEFTRVVQLRSKIALDSNENKVKLDSAQKKLEEYNAHNEKLLSSRGLWFDI